jgi:predicted nuclease with RNAse H fold
MLTVGVDLAAEPRTTAVAWLEWSADRAVLSRLEVGCGDEVILDAIAAADRAGIDCPFGWPDPFVAFVSEHRAATLPPGSVDRSRRRDLTLRLTDRIVHEKTGLTPLSVSADRIAHPAMRCAGLLARLAENEGPVDRAGTGKVVEVYPAASLKCWQLQPRGYKRAANVETLGTLITALTRHTDPWLDLGSFEAVCRRVDDAADALIAALTVRAALTTPTESERATACREGWIGLPTTPLADLPQAPPC